MENTKIVVRIWFEDQDEMDNRGFWAVEMPYPSFGEFMMAVEAGRWIYGNRLWTRNDQVDRGLKHIMRRTEVAFKGETVVRTDLSDMVYEG